MTKKHNQVTTRVCACDQASVRRTIVLDEARTNVLKTAAGGLAADS